VTARFTLKAPAKINLSLEVLARRADGYHEVRMLMAGLSLADELSFESAKGLSLTCDRPELECGPNNLVLRAARALQTALGSTAGAKIHLKKRIPLGGGLAGGSADAAATLKGLNRLWRGGMNYAELSRIAANLGSDIPFCLKGAWAFATGRGEKIEALSLDRRLCFVLANPGFEVSTPWVYAHLPDIRSSRRNLTRLAFEAIQRQDLAVLKKVAVNDLEPVTSGRYTEIGVLKRLLVKEGALLSRMSGSGPTVWGLFEDTISAKKACQVIKKMNYWVMVAHTKKGH